MTITVAIQHNTYYEFDRPINLSPHVVRLRPAPHSRTPIKSYSLKVSPTDHFLNWQQDPYGNFNARLVFPEKTTRFAVEVEVIADMTVINPFDFFIEDYAEEFPFKYSKQLRKELEPYLQCTSEGEEFTKLLEGIDRTPKRTIDFLVGANQVVQNLVEYTVRMEPGVQTPEETLEKALGSCRDSAWLLVQLLRHLGLAARFASGYLVQLKSDEKSLDGPSGPEEDFTDLHAWCEVFLPGAGWVGMDPTSGLFASEGHIPLACTPDPVSAAPIEGMMDECEVEFSYSNTVSRIHEDPRVTKPYTEAEWADVLALGNKVDDCLTADDVRLTMGGEPTFVSIDDMESAQWNTAALGADKLSLAKKLLLRLRDHFAPKGLLHYGQGKWYPGEEVPRWALGLFWRTDGKALWRRPEFLARIDKNYGHTIEDAKRFSERLIELLNVPERCLHPAFEDGLHYLQEEQNLPVGVDAKIAKAKDSLDRRRLAKVLEQGLDVPTAYVIPVEWNYHGDSWQSSTWDFRRGRLTLIPGDSPVGLRLPLGSLPPAKEEDNLADGADPFRDMEPLPVAKHVLKAAQKSAELSRKFKQGKK
ncbi:MAG: transglutaminase family protein, partial [Oleibacter sp.]|nr:transglutaminase family protein [Thalassolituus sp.]